MVTQQTENKHSPRYWWKKIEKPSILNFLPFVFQNSCLSSASKGASQEGEHGDTQV